MPAPPDLLRGVEEISRDRRSGGRELGLKALRVAEELCRRARQGELGRGDVEAVLREIRRCRKAMGIVYNVGDMGLKALGRGGDWLENLSRALRNMRGILEASRERMVRFSRQVLRGVSSVATISFSSNVFAALTEAGSVSRVVLLESRPGEEVVDAYRRLSGAGIEVTVLPDSNMLYAVKRSDAVVVGADSITARDCFLIHKAGTSPLLTLARAVGVRTVVICEALKLIDAEVGSIEMERWRYRVERLDAEFDSYPFDWTPINLVETLVTDHGLVEEPEDSDIARVYLDVLMRVLD